MNDKANLNMLALRSEAKVDNTLTQKYVYSTVE